MSEVEEERLKNPFADSSPKPTKNSNDFIAFSSTPINPNQPSQFRPKRGKNNRQYNWQRFGDSPFGSRNDDRKRPFNSRGSSPHFRGSPYRRGGVNSSNANQSLNIGGANHPHFYSNTGNHSFRGGFHQNFRPDYNQSFNRRGGRRGNHRNNLNYHNDGSFRHKKTYFHPSMLEDPWAHLSDDLSESTTVESGSDSLIPNVDDSLFERNIDELMSKNSTSSINPAPSLDDTVDESMMVNIGETNDDISMNSTSKLQNMSTNNEVQNDTIDDSMKVLISDSILERTDSSS